MPTKKPIKKKSEPKNAIATIEKPEMVEQPIIEVGQERLKKALKDLMTNNESKRSQIIEELYDAHAEYNKEYFFGELSFPLITFDKLDNRTLGDYTHGTDAMGIENHIRFNVNFIALNPMSRVLETLKHEMIHQWQDEVLYYKSGKPKGIRIKMVDDKGNVTEGKIDQKRFPADRHNKDFKEMAKVVGIPAEGDKCYGNPANMPEAKSYNRKYQCGCVASNGYKVTIWSTRPIQGKCLRCGKVYHEVLKDGGLIKVKRSHIEPKGVDAIQQEMNAKGYSHFEKFKSRKEYTAFLDDLEADEGIKLIAQKSGVYESNHNAHKEGYTHWIAYNPLQKPEEPSEEPKQKVDKKPARKDTKKKEPTKKAKPVEVPVKQPKPKKVKPEPQIPSVTVEIVNTTPIAVEPPKEQEPVNNVIEFKPKEEPKEKRDYDYKNPQDLLDLYKELGSVKAVAEHFGMTSANIIYHAKKGNVNFKKGVIEDGGK